MRNRLFRIAGIGFIALSAACGVHSTETPPLSGPSTLATSIGITATPDRITQDGASQSSILVTVNGPTGQPVNGAAVRLDMVVGGQVVDYGTLATKSIVTGSDGKAHTIYTAPSAPPPPADQTTATVSIRATVIASDAQVNNPVAADIRLVPAGVILPPADTPTPSFTFNPTAPTTNSPTLFDGSSSCAGAAVNGACSPSSSTISSYAWSFGDGAVANGQTASHSYTIPNTYNATLTVTNSRGVSATVSKTVTVGAGTAPGAQFVFSPAQPSAGQAIVFNATQSTAGPGHNLTSFAWIFGDGSTGSGSLVTHSFAAAGTYNVTLTVTDDAGQRTTTSQSVAIAAGGGGSGGATTALFISSPASPVVGQVVFFNASASTAAAGKTITTYSWNFGDGTKFDAATSSTSHTFTTPGTFTVSLAVTDSGGGTATTTANVIVAAAGSTAPTSKFTFSPTAPVVNQQVVFDASTSTAGPALTIVDYGWVFGDGAPVIHTTSRTIAHSYAFANTFSVSLTVTDSLGSTNASSQTVTVVVGAVPNANFTFTPAVGVAGQAVAFDGSSSTFTAPATSIANYAWNFGDGSPLVNTGATATTSHPFAAGTYSITLTITDNLGLYGYGI